MAKWIYGVRYMISSCCNKKYDVRDFAYISRKLLVPCKCPNCATYLNPPDTELLELVGLDNEDNTSKHCHWDSHKRHWELLKEFYALNKYLISEQLKDTLLDAIECMEYTMVIKGEKYQNGSGQDEL